MPCLGLRDPSRLPPVGADLDDKNVVYPMGYRPCQSQATVRAAIREEISTITRRAELVTGALEPFDTEWEPEFNQGTLESIARVLHYVSGALGLAIEVLGPDDLIFQVVRGQSGGRVVVSWILQCLQR